MLQMLLFLASRARVNKAKWFLGHPGDGSPRALGQLRRIKI